MGFKKVTYGTNMVVVALLVAGILVIINAFSYRHFFRVDLTENKKFTISSSTRNVLAELDDIVNIKVYLSKKLPPYMVTVTNQVKDILEEYRIYSDGAIELEYIDPGDDPAMQQKLRFMGIPQLRLNIIEKDQAAISNVYMGLAILFGDNKEIIPALTDLETFEYELTGKILRVASSEVQTIGFLSGHGEADLNKDLGTINNLLKEQYYTKAVDTSKGEKIPSDISALVVAGPKQMTDRDLFEVDQYLMSGGKVIFLTDMIDIQSQRMQGSPLNSPITRLIEHYGIQLADELVLDQLNANASFQSGMFNIFIPYPFWVRAVRQSVEGAHPIINQIESMVLPWASPLEIIEEKTKDKTVDILAKSSPYSWIQKGFFDLNPRQDFRPSPEQLQSRTLAVAVQGSFDSYFAGKAVPPVENAQQEDAGTNDEKKPTEEERSIAAKSPETKIIVVGNSRFITSNFPEQFEGNRTFFQNAIDWFVIGDKLIDIRSRETGERPLKVVSDNVKAGLRLANMFAVPVLLAVFGVVQYLIRRRRKRLGVIT